MKKLFYIFSTMLVLSVACKNDDPEPEAKKGSDTVLTKLYDTLTIYDTVRVPIMCDHSWVVYVLNNGTDEIDTLDIKNGASIKLKSDATRFGYDFVKWSTSPMGGGTDYVAGDNFYVNKDITLYAIWQSHDGLRSNEVYEFLSKQESGSTVDIKIIDLYPDFNAIGTALLKFWKVNVNLDLGDATEVGEGPTFDCFSYCANLKSLIFPPNIQSLSTSGGSSSCCAFTKLDNIPSSVRSLKICKCAYLTTLIIPEGVTSLWVSECPKLTSINIPNSVTDIGWGISDCSSLTEITIPPSVESVNILNFSGCTNLKTITHSVKDCEGINFEGCKSLTSITLPEFRIGHTEIPYNAFRDCSSLTSLTIPDGITSINGEAFSGCTNLNSLTIKSNTPPTLFGSLCYSGTIYVPSSAVNTYKTADGWKDYTDQIVGY